MAHQGKIYEKPLACEGKRFFYQFETIDQVNTEIALVYTKSNLQLTNN
jgi:hypothetical protein